ncbi:hypothetical protein HYZ41_03140 [archaeon]|nr:hypothetical protein [archaeon]
MEYWHDIQTEKSWEVLKSLKGKFKFVLIGGWAVYLWSHSHKSKDIDIIVDFQTLSRLKQIYDVRKNDKLRKYEIKIDEIDVDIYVKYFSPLVIKPEDVKSTKIEGFDVARPEYLLALKQGAEFQRKESEKGEKDRIDIISMLLKCDIGFGEYMSILKSIDRPEFFSRLISIVKNFNDPSHFGMNPREFRLEKNRILKKLKETR